LYILFLNFTAVIVAFWLLQQRAASDGARIHMRLGTIAMLVCIVLPTWLHEPSSQKVKVFLP